MHSHGGGSQFSLEEIVAPNGQKLEVQHDLTEVHFGRKHTVPCSLYELNARVEKTLFSSGILGLSLIVQQ